MSTAFSNHYEQAATRVFVMFMNFEVLGQMQNTRRQHRHLHLRRSSIILVDMILGNEFFLICSRQPHEILSSVYQLAPAPPLSGCAVPTKVTSGILP